MEGDFVARSSITKMIESTIGGNGNRVNGVIITNLEAISSRPDQSEDAPSFPLLGPFALAPSTRVIEFFTGSFSNLETRLRSKRPPIACYTAFAFLHFQHLRGYILYIYIYNRSTTPGSAFPENIEGIVRCNSTCPPCNRPSYQIADVRRVSRVSQIPRRISIKLGQISEVS